METQSRSELGTVYKSFKNRIHMALVYPNTYEVGMANLGFQSVYMLANALDGVVCERSFLIPGQPPGKKSMRTIESGQPLGNADIIAFSIAFENDYLNLLQILQQAGLPLKSAQRGQSHPLVIAGGVACTLNPEPIAPFIDCFLIGEAEAILPNFFDIYAELANDDTLDRNRVLQHLARNVPGTYVPRFYRPIYGQDQTLDRYDVLADVPTEIRRQYLHDISTFSTHSGIVTQDTTFKDMFLIETGRGCPHGCRFCSAGYIYRPPRFRPTSLLLDAVDQYKPDTSHRVGLVGAAISDLPDIDKLCPALLERNIQISFSSLRTDALVPDRSHLADPLLTAITRSGVKTTTIAPDAGSERMRRIINKGITEADLLDATRAIVTHGIPNLKLYFMVGLPFETPDDVDAIVQLCKKTKQIFLDSSRKQKRIGSITVNLNCFVPKPFTPFQWQPMAPTSVLKKSIAYIKRHLKTVANVRVHADSPRKASIQALLSRGDRRVADLLIHALKNRGNWPQTLKSAEISTDFYIHRQREPEERFPWEILQPGVRRRFLYAELKRASSEKSTPPCAMDGCDKCMNCPLGP